MKDLVVIGTRGSKLALWQARHVAGMLSRAHPNIAVELKHIVTTGDKILDAPLAQIGGKGLFTKELETAMLAGEIDLAVHSLKDVPAALPNALVLAAILRREDPQDAWVSPGYRTWSELPPGAVVGTSSLRRQAQLLRLRPDLSIVSLRGNLDTRLRKLDEGQFAAIVLAAAGLRRLGWTERIASLLPVEDFLPAVGQGALAIETRREDTAIRKIVACLEDEAARDSVTAERSFLSVVEGGCQVPLGVYGRFEARKLILQARILSLDGRRCVEGSSAGTGEAAAELGAALAEELLAAGGREILAELERMT